MRRFLPDQFTLILIATVAFASFSRPWARARRS